MLLAKYLNIWGVYLQKTDVFIVFIIFFELLLLQDQYYDYDIN